jgi:hypothetical protein
MVSVAIFISNDMSNIDHNFSGRLPAGRFDRILAVPVAIVGN